MASLPKESKKAKLKLYKAETLDGRAVKDLRPFENGWVGFVDGLKMVWDAFGTTGKGIEWTLQKIK